MIWSFKIIGNSSVPILIIYTCYFIQIIIQSELDSLLCLLYVWDFLLLFECFLPRDFECFFFSIIYAQFALTFFPCAMTAATATAIVTAMLSLFLLLSVCAWGWSLWSFVYIFLLLPCPFLQSRAKCPTFPHLKQPSLLNLEIKLRSFSFS